MSIARVEKSAEVVFSLPQGFANKVVKAITEEISISERKWGVNITSEQRQEILEHSVLQLENKVFATFKKAWRYKEPRIRVCLSTGLEYAGPRQVALPEDKSNCDDILVIRGHNELIISNEPSSASFKMNNLPAEVQNMIITWIRTAAFYGVASYT